MKKKESHQFFKADKFSGMESSIYGSTFFLEVLKIHNLRHRFKFPWYSLTYSANNKKADEWIDEVKYKDISDEIIKFVKRNGPSYFIRLGLVQRKEARKFIKYCDKVLRKISALPNDDLVFLYYEFINKYFWYFAWGSITFIYEHILSERLFDALAKKYGNATEIISNLLKTKYQSFMVKSENLLKDIKDCKMAFRKGKLIKKYIDNYFCVDTSYGLSPVMNKKKVMQKVAKIGNCPARKIEIGKGRFNISKLNLSKNEQLIVDILRETEIVRDKRKQIAMSGVYVLYRFLDEAVKRTGIKMKIAEKSFWFEFSDLLQNIQSTMNNLEKRKEASIVLDGNKYFYADRIIVSEKNAVSKNIKEVKGTAASKGKYKGRVVLVFGQKDFMKIKKGDILVAEMTRPDFLPIMKMAGAIVTDEGGLTSHAAIISRELNIPCIVGAKIATRVLKDGDLVEIDATRGVVKIIK